MVMHLVKLVQILLLVAVANRCVGEDCIESFLDLESSILTDEFNIQSLIHAFFPANHYPALVVEVHYYVNESNNGGLFYHPIQPQASEDNFFADYIFSWVSSPGLLYGDPNILEGLSLRSLAIDYHYAHLVILPFCSDDNELDKKYILGLLNNVTIWLKSYALKRSSSLYEGLLEPAQGYVSYKKDNERDEFFVFGREQEYEGYVVVMAIALFALIIFCAVVVPVEVDSFYVILHEKSEKNQKRDKQHFRFRSIFWAFISVLGWSTVVILGVDFHHFYDFGLNWISRYRVGYFLIVGCAVILGIMDVIASILIIRRAYKKNAFIQLPEVIKVLLCISKDWHQDEDEDEEDRRQKCHQGCQSVMSIICQFLAVIIILVSFKAISFHSCGVILAILVNPVQVIATVTIYLLVALCGIFASAFIYEKTEEILRDEKHGKTLRIRLIFQILVFVCIMIFIVLFGYTYLTVILFIGDDNIGVISSAAKVFPLILLTAITWVMKKELQKYTGSDNSPSTLLPTTSQSYDVESSLNSVMLVSRTELNGNV